MGGVTGVLEPVTRPRFPLEWLEREELEPPRPPRHRLEWWRLLMFTMVLLAVSLLVPARIAPPPHELVPAHRYWVEGTVERLQAMPSGTSTITVVAVTGRATTAALDFGQTSVFYYRNGIGSIAHLKLGQQVRLLQERGVAKSIEILREPIPSLLP